ncbi:uncharacterized protein LOC131937520 [Physella acuta]|uniref:uncharacterized protein LOC131937520 n=1 Tax=Physella acuta TaxID=109671 RepID=UPI0027DE0088|nr:uncharacterized protein LOC131937520 [Physella acuta]
METEEQSVSCKAKGRMRHATARAIETEQERVSRLDKQKERTDAALAIETEQERCGQRLGYDEQFLRNNKNQSTIHSYVPVVRPVLLRRGALHIPRLVNRRSWIRIFPPPHYPHFKHDHNNDPIPGFTLPHPDYQDYSEEDYGYQNDYTTERSFFKPSERSYYLF